MDKKSQKIQQEILQVLPMNLRKRLQQTSLDYRYLQEIRLRIEKPVVMVIQGKEYFLNQEGGVSKSEQLAYKISGGELSEALEYLSNYSRYAFGEEMRQGYVTIQGGHRVGIAGKVIQECGIVKSIQHITFLNIRLAHEVRDCGKKVISYLWKEKTFCHTLIISPPRGGKTTLLRDLIRLLSNGEQGQDGRTVGVVDERSELAACYLGKPQNDLGIRTDVLDGCPKAEGMLMMIRSMAPDIIAVDEIGSAEDIAALEYAMNCGVGILATIHGNDMDEIKQKPVFGRMVREKMFQRYILLDAEETGRIKAVFDERGVVLCHKERVGVKSA